MSTSQSEVAPGVNTHLTTCPICREPAEPALLADLIDPQIEPLVMQLAPGWRAEMGICPNCMGRVLQTLTNAGHDLYSLLAHRETSKTDPAVAAAGQAALPVPLRLHANPVFRGKGVVIAYLDSGFYPHPDLTLPHNRILLTVDATHDPPLEGADFSVPQRRAWHGMMTSVVAAGNGYLSGGRYRGIASEVELVLVQVGDANMRIPDAAIEIGLDWMLANHKRLNIKVLNISLGGDDEMHSHLSPLDRAVNKLTAEGVLVVVAAGNSGRQMILPPASAESALTVGGASDENILHVRSDRFSLWWSSYGPTLDGVQKPEVVAPSIWLASPILPGTRQAREAGRLAGLLQLSAEELHRRWEDVRRELRMRHGALSPERTPEELRAMLVRRMAHRKWLSAGYQFVDGTSVAAPIVTSVAAQVREANPALTPEQVKRIIMETAIPMNNVPADRQGSGVVNPAAAVTAALRAQGGAMYGLPISPYSVPGTVTFHYYNPNVERVALVSDFNGWRSAGYEFDQIRPGVFSFNLYNLPPGLYQYKFLLDQASAVDDPENPLKQLDGYGGFSSILTAPAR